MDNSILQQVARERAALAETRRALAAGEPPPKRAALEVPTPTSVSPSLRVFSTRHPHPHPCPHHI